MCANSDRSSGELTGTFCSRSVSGCVGCRPAIFGVRDVPRSDDDAAPATVSDGSPIWGGWFSPYASAWLALNTSHADDAPRALPRPLLSLLDACPRGERRGRPESGAGVNAKDASVACAAESCAVDSGSSKPKGEEAALTDVPIDGLGLRAGVAAASGPTESVWVPAAVALAPMLLPRCDSLKKRLLCSLATLLLLLLLPPGSAALAPAMLDWKGVPDDALELAPPLTLLRGFLNGFFASALLRMGNGG